MWKRIPYTLLISLISLFLFIVLATANGAGYRYGVSDQAFYIPAVVRAYDPATFPHDGALIEAQARLMVVDEVLAGLMRTTGAPLHVLFACGYFVSLILIWAALTRIGATLYVHRWTTVALLAAFTLRHQITRTSANTFEPYFHPRMLAFGICALAVAAVLRRRGWMAIALVALSGAVHPTTAMWFALLIGVALLVSDRGLRPVLAGGAVLAVLVAGWAVATGPLAGSFVVIDADWREVLAGKTSLLANQWPLAAWLANLGTAAVWAWAYFDRRRRGLATPEDTGLAAGGAALVALFLATLPFVAAGVSFFVELQISRVFWIVDVMATVCVLGAIERIGRQPQTMRAAAAVLIAFSCVRGAYSLYVDHPERRLFALTLDDSPWHDAMRWIAAQPADVHVLADPGHAWKYGTSVRVSAERDVFQEDVKDSALAIYSRDVAMRVLERSRAIGDFAQLTPDRARALAARYDLDCLVTTAALDLPVAYRNQQFTIYALGQQATERGDLIPARR
jgi:hypothetical protein